MHLENFSRYFRALIQLFDDWFHNRRPAILFETRVGNGKLVVPRPDLKANLAEHPAAKHPMFSLKIYMNFSKFNPEEAVDPDILKDLSRLPPG